MTEYRITRSKDIELYIGEEQLFGVTDLASKSVYEEHPIREYLSGEPYATVNAKNAYEIRMSVLSLFSFSVPDGSPFSFRLIDGDAEYLYEGCMVIRHERSVEAGKNVVDKYVITAKNMRKQVQNDA